MGRLIETFKRKEVPDEAVERTREYIEGKLNAELTCSLFYGSVEDVIYIQNIIEPYFFKSNLVDSFIQKVLK